MQRRLRKETNHFETESRLMSQNSSYVRISRDKFLISKLSPITAVVYTVGQCNDILSCGFIRFQCNQRPTQNNSFRKIFVIL